MEAGRIESYIHSDGMTPNKHGALVKVLTQTDFAARTPEVSVFAQRVASLAVGFQEDDYDQLVVQMPSLEQDRLALESLIKEKVQVVSIVRLVLE